MTEALTTTSMKRIPTNIRGLSKARMIALILFLALCSHCEKQKQLAGVGGGNTAGGNTTVRRSNQIEEGLGCTLNTDLKVRGELQLEVLKFVNGWQRIVMDILPPNIDPRGEKLRREYETVYRPKINAFTSRNDREELAVKGVEFVVEATVYAYTNFASRSPSRWSSSKLNRVLGIDDNKPSGAEVITGIKVLLFDLQEVVGTLH